MRILIYIIIIQFYLLFIYYKKIYLIMKNFLNELFTLSLFMLAIFLGYLSFIITTPSLIVNVFLFIVAIFVLIKACDKLDKELGIGEYKDHNDEQEESDK